MIEALLAAAVAVAPAPAPTTQGLVAPCIWSKLPAYKQQVLTAPDYESFKRLRGAYPEGALEAAFDACVPEGGGDQAAGIAFTYYEVSLWAERRLAGKWPQARLAVIDSLPEQDLQYFWLQPAPDKTPEDYKAKRAEAYARVYGPFGRTGPASAGSATPDDLDSWIIGRVGWRLGELDYKQGLARR